MNADHWLLDTDNWISTRLRQSVFDLHPGRFRAHMQRFGNCQTGIAIQGSGTETNMLRVLVLSLKDRRTAPAAKNPMVAGRRLPFFKQLLTADKS